MHRSAIRGPVAALTMLLVLPLLVAAPGAAAAQSAGYHDFTGLTAELEALAASSPAAELSSLGTSREGRDIWLVTLAAPSGPDPDTRPGVLVVGNLEGDYVGGSELALGVIRHLVSGDAAADAVLAERVVYVVPRLNPDAAEAMFGAVRTGRRGNTRPYDDDNDGRIDEDGADDLNGDGVITVMRVTDPEGAYVADADDPRLLRPADRAKGESGMYSVYWEGVDNDGDGFYNEDGRGGVDPNRNFQHAYPYFAPDAGPHMVSEPETRALMDFMVRQRNIAAILAYGASDNLVTDYDGQGNPGGQAGLELVAFAEAADDGVYDIGNFNAGGGGFGFGFGFFFGGGGGPQLRGAQLGRDNDPNSGRRPETTFNAQDREYLGRAAEAYREITGIAEVGLNRAAEGAFFQFGYFHYGVPSFSTPGWGLPPSDDDGDAAESGEPGGMGRGGPPAGGGRGAMMGRGGMMGRGMQRGGPPGGGGGGGAAAPGADAQVLGALEGAGIDAFVDWTPHEHPQLGTVEIGGFRPYATHNPPADQLPALGEAQGRFVVQLADMLPRVEVVDTEVTAHGGGVFSVSATIQNSGYFPTALRQGLTARSVQPTMVQIQVAPDNVLTGDAKTSTVDRLEGSGGRASFTWVIRGNDGDAVEILVRSQKGGTSTTTVTLR